MKPKSLGNLILISAVLTFAAVFSAMSVDCNDLASVGECPNPGPTPTTAGACPVCDDYYEYGTITRWAIWNAGIYMDCQYISFSVPIKHYSSGPFSCVVNDCLYGFVMESQQCETVSCADLCSGER